MNVLDIIVLVAAGLFLIFAGYVIYKRGFKGYSADMKKRDEKGKIIK